MSCWCLPNVISGFIQQSSAQHTKIPFDEAWRALSYRLLQYSPRADHSKEKGHRLKHFKNPVSPVRSCMPS